MNDVAQTAANAKVTGQEHWTSKGDVKLFMWEKCVGDPAKSIGTILFVHGSSMASQPTFDLQVPGPQRFIGDGCVRAARLRLLVGRHGRLWPLDQGPRQQCADRARRRRLLRRRDLYPEAAGQSTVPRLRHFLGRAARRDVRRASSRAGRPPRARRHGVDRRRLAHARRPPQETARNSRPRTGGRSTRPSSIRSSTATTPAAPRKTSSTPSPTRSSRSTARCRPAPMSICAPICRWSIRPRSRRRP